MAYVKKIWKDYPDTTTPILAEDLNNIENGIEAVDTTLENLENNVNNIEDGLETVTNNVNNGWYQTGLSPTFTFVSWDNSVHTGVVNSNLDLTSYLSVGMKVKFTQSATVKFGIITAITSTQLTLFLGTDYSLNTSAISNSYYSMLKAPYGFPMDPDKWSVLFTSTTHYSQTNPVKDTVYNLGSANIAVPIGVWNLSYSMDTYTQRPVNNGTNAMFCGISTSNNSYSDAALKRGCSVGSLVQVGTYGVSEFEVIQTLSNKTISLTSKTVFYVVASTNQAGISIMTLNNPLSALDIKFVSAYL